MNKRGNGNWEECKTTAVPYESVQGDEYFLNDKPNYYLDVGGKIIVYNTTKFDDQRVWKFFEHNLLFLITILVLKTVLKKVFFKQNFLYGCLQWIFLSKNFIRDFQNFIDS